MHTSLRGAAGAVAFVSVFVAGLVLGGSASRPAAAAPPSGERYKVVQPPSGSPQAVEQALTIEATNGWFLREAYATAEGRPTLILAQVQGSGGQAAAKETPR